MNPGDAMLLTAAFLVGGVITLLVAYWVRPSRPPVVIIREPFQMTTPAATEMAEPEHGERVVLVGGVADGEKLANLPALPAEIIRKGYGDPDTAMAGIPIETIYHRTAQMLEGRWVYREVER